MSGFDARIDESSESDSRSRSGLRVQASSVHVAITSSSSLSFSSPEVQRSGVLPLGTAIEAIVEQPNVEMPLGTNNCNNSEVQLALGNGSPDATLSQFLQGSPNDQMQNVPANPFDRSSYPEPSSTGPVGSPGIGNTYVMNYQ